MFVKIDPMDKLFKGLTGLTSFSNSVLNRAGADLVKRIKDRVRLGYGCASDGGSKSKFKSLAAATIKSREWLKGKGKLASYSSPGKSHLTATGAMMDNLAHQVKSGVLTILFPSRKEADKAKINSETRPFMHLTKTEVKAVSDILQEYIDNLPIL